MGFTVETEVQRQLRRPRTSKPMAHTPYGWPHYREGTLRCICLENCCQDEKGCRCKSCECRIKGESCHDTITPFTLTEKAEEIIALGTKALQQTGTDVSTMAGKSALIRWLESRYGIRGKR